jgi:hypothetical protein
MPGGVDRADQRQEQAALIVAITPEASDDERDAIVAALAVLSAPPLEAAPARLPPSSRWARAGRLAGLRWIASAADGWRQPSRFESKLTADG